MLAGVKKYAGMCFVLMSLTAFSFPCQAGTTWEPEDPSVRKAANDLENGNWGMMTPAQQAEVTAAIDAWIAQSGVNLMSDYEKTIEILSWLAGKCQYQVGNDWENATAYSVIINGRAQCSGYADAFLQTAKRARLSARYVHNAIHAFCIVSVNGSWYYVDPTWVDDNSNATGIETFMKAGISQREAYRNFQKSLDWEYTFFNEGDVASYGATIPVWEGNRQHFYKCHSNANVPVSILGGENLRGNIGAYLNREFSNVTVHQNLLSYEVLPSVTSTYRANGEKVDLGENNGAFDPDAVEAQQESSDISQDPVNQGGASRGGGRVVR